MAQSKLSINIPSSPSRRLSDISLSPVRVYDVEQLRLLPPELDAKAHSDPVLAQYLYFTVVAGPDEQAVFEEQTRLWILKTLSLPESFEDTSRLSFAKRLRNGVIACRVLHFLWPQLRSESLASPSGKPSLHAQTDSSRRNLETFLDGCESLGVPVATAHSTRDQLRHDILSYTSTRAIIFCLLELSRLAAAQGLATPPSIIALEAAIDAGDRSDPLDSARSVLDQIEGSAPSRTSSPSSSSGSESEHGRTHRAESVASSTVASALSRSESEPSTAEGPASSREHRPSRGRRNSSISVQIVSESDAESSATPAVSMSIEVGEASGAPSLFANFEAHSTTPLSRQQPEVRRSKWRTIATAPEAAQQAEFVVVAVSSDSSASTPAASAAAPVETPPAVNVEVTPTAQAPRNRFFFAELSPRSSLANRLSGGAYARSKWRSIAVHTEHATTPISQQTAQHAGNEGPKPHPQATPMSPSTAKAPVASGKQEASFDSPEGSKPTNTGPQEPSTESSPITFLHDYLPVAGDAIDEAVAACFLRNKMRIRPVRLSKGSYLFSSVNRVLRSPRNQAEALSPRLKRASRVFSFGDGPIDPTMLSAFPFPVTPVSSVTNSTAAAPTGPSTVPDSAPNVPSSPSVSMSLSLSGSDADGPITVEAPVRLISNALLVRYDGLWMDLRAFVSRFVTHVSATRKSRMLASLNTAIDTPLLVSPLAVRASESAEFNVAEADDMDEDGGVCETDVIVLEDQLRECFLDTMLPKLAHYDVSKIGQFSSELLFRKAIAEGVSCDRYDEFIEEELGRLTRHKSTRKHGYDAQPSPAPHGVKRPHANPSSATESSGPQTTTATFPGRTQHSQIRQFVKRLLRR